MKRPQVAITTFLWVPDDFGLPDNELIDRAAKVAVVALPLRQTLQSFQQISRDTLRRNYRIYGNKYY